MPFGGPFPGDVGCPGASCGVATGLQCLSAVRSPVTKQGVLEAGREARLQCLSAVRSPVTGTNETDTAYDDHRSPMPFGGPFPGDPGCRMAWITTPPGLQCLSAVRSPVTCRDGLAYAKSLKSPMPFGGPFPGDTKKL